MPGEIVKVNRDGSSERHGSLIHRQTGRVGQDKGLALHRSFSAAWWQGQLLPCAVKANDVLARVGEQLAPES